MSERKLLSKTFPSRNSEKGKLLMLSLLEVEKEEEEENLKFNDLWNFQNSPGVNNCKLHALS